MTRAERAQQEMNRGPVRMARRIVELEDALRTIAFLSSHDPMMNKARKLARAALANPSEDEAC